MTSPPADFGALGVPRPIAVALAKLGATEPFPIQASTIPHALDGRDVLGRAPTGSGKTYAFGIPLLARLAEAADGRAEPRRPTALVLSPTRELAEQIRRDLEPLAAAVDRAVLAVYGGVAIGPQTAAIRRGVDLLVACPGRLQDLIDRGDVQLGAVSIVVVDEADRMADMGFLPAVTSLLELTPTERQLILFSATLDGDVDVLVRRFQHDAITCSVGDLEPDLSTVDHRFISATKESKLTLAADLIDDAGTTIVFCRTRHGVDRVARQLRRVGVKAGWIHGGRTQSQRDAALSAFTTGRVAALVATDVAARGIHVDGVECVIHYDPPADAKDYIHRSGRTARAGAGGTVISLVNNDQRRAVAKLQHDAGLPKSEPEPTPELRERETVAWVDERNGATARKGRPHKGAAPDRGRRKQRRDERQPEGDGRDAPLRRRRPTGTDGDTAADDRRAGRRRQARSDRASKGATRRAASHRTGPAADVGYSNDGTPHDERGATTERSKRSGPPAEKAKRSKRAGPAAEKAGGPKRSGPTAKKAGSTKRSGPTTTKAKGSKRSGRPRAKDHKQRRNRSSR